MAVLVERATSDLLTGPDWGMNLEICDAINHNPSLSRDMVKALRKRLSNKNAKVQLLALMVLEMIMKNCGDPVHQMVAKDVLHDMVKIVKKKGDLAVWDKVLALLESWQKAFGGPLAKYSQYSAVYDDLRRLGVQFPVQGDADTVSMFTPPMVANLTTVAAPTTHTIAATNTTRSLPELAYGLPEFPPARLDDVLAASAENSVWSTKDLDGARRTLEVLNEMLNALDPGDKQAIHDDVIAHLVEQCMTNQKIVRQLVNSTSDENILCQGLALNDDIQQILAKHSALVSNALTSAELMPGSLSSGPQPQGLAVYDNEDDEAEDELLRLAHRSRPSRPQENGLRKNTPFGQPAPYLEPAAIPIVPTVGSQNFDQGNGVMQGSSLAASSSGQVTPGGSHQLSKEQESMLNPFASTAPTTASPANGSLSPASHYPSCTEKTYVSDNVWSSDLPSQKQDYAIQASEREQAPHNSSTLFDDDMVNPTASWSTGLTKQPVSGLPPPPSKYTERARFFEEQRQASPSLISSSSMDGRMQNLNLNMDEAVHANGVAHAAFRSPNKPVSAADKQADRLFEDLVDLGSMRTSYRAPGVASSLSRSKGSGANGM